MATFTRDIVPVANLYCFLFPVAEEFLSLIKYRSYLAVSHPKSLVSEYFKDNNICPLEPMVILLKDISEADEEYVTPGNVTVPRPSG